MWIGADRHVKSAAARERFSVILSNHALEYAYQADEVIAAASRLQNEGDRLIIAVPNQEGESPMGVFLFLPHLQSFTRASLERLWARHGYAVVDDHRVRSRQLVLMFRRSASVPAVAPLAAGGTRSAGEVIESLDRWSSGTCEGDCHGRPTQHSKFNSQSPSAFCTNVVRRSLAMSLSPDRTLPLSY